MNEFEIIEHHFRRHAIGRDDVLLGIGDDAALLDVPAGAHVLGTQVTLVPEDEEQADAFAARLLARAQARLVCQCVTPCWATLALTVGRADMAWLQGFAACLAAALARQEVALVGGDTTRGPRCATLALHGHVVALPAPLAVAAGDQLLLADAGELAVDAALRALPRQRASIACDDDIAAAAAHLARAAGLRVVWQRTVPDALPAGAVLLAMPAHESAPFTTLRHVATLQSRVHD